MARIERAIERQGLPQGLRKRAGAAEVEGSGPMASMLRRATSSADIACDGLNKPAREKKSARRSSGPFVLALIPQAQIWTTFNSSRRWRIRRATRTSCQFRTIFRI
jgi:hypothetical protein